MATLLTTNDPAEKYFTGRNEHLVFVKVVNEGQISYETLYSIYTDIHFARNVVNKFLFHKVAVKGGQALFYMPPEDR